MARTAAGAWWAVQCKFYNKGAVPKADIDTFLSASSRTFMVDAEHSIRGEVKHSNSGSAERTGFDARYIIYTGREMWGRIAEDAIVNQNPPVVRITTSDLAAANVNWEAIDNGTFGEAAILTAGEPFPYQRNAINAAIEYYKEHDRGKLIMACGTGKTFTSLCIAQHIVPRGGMVLFLVPSISLVSQSLREWSNNARLNFICVCSDPKVSVKEEANDIGGERITDIALPATTNPKTLAKMLAVTVVECRPQGGRCIETTSSDPQFTVVFSTYQSIDVVSEAQKEYLKAGGKPFDLIIADEAHRTTGAKLTGKDESSFTRVHDNKFIAARYRMYMTATPRIYTDSAKVKATEKDTVLCSMDDEAIYGSEFYRIGFRDAVNIGRLSEYKVMIFTVSEKDIPCSLMQRV